MADGDGHDQDRAQHVHEDLEELQEPADGAVLRHRKPVVDLADRVQESVRRSHYGPHHEDHGNVLDRVVDARRDVGYEVDPVVDDRQRNQVGQAPKHPVVGYHVVPVDGGSRGKALDELHQVTAGHEIREPGHG